MIQTQTLNVVTLDDCTAWLAEHGIDIADVQTAVVRIDRGPTTRDVICAWLDVTFLLKDDLGNRYTDFVTQGAATGSATIPLRSWPKLTAR